jgi:hypothetical protein
LTDKCRFVCKFDCILAELQRDREEQARKWEENNRKWNEFTQEQGRKWDEQNLHNQQILEEIKKLT